MFIKPIDCSILPAITWTDRAVNNHFALQSKKASTFQSLFSSLAIPAHLKAIAEYEFRIVLKLKDGRRFVVSVDETFDRIHADWNWVESNLFLKRIDDQSMTSAELEVTLLKQFEDMTIEAAELQSSSELTKHSALRDQFSVMFPALTQEVFLNAFNCTYAKSEIIILRGQLFVTRNYVSFCSQGPPDTLILLSFKDINSLSIAPSSRVLLPDGIEIGANGQKYLFALYFMRSEIFRMLSALCYAAMHKLIRGAEVSSCSEMLNKPSISTGDLGNFQKGNLALDASLNSYGFRDAYNDEEDDDFTNLELMKSTVSPRSNPIDISDSAFENYANIDPSLIRTTDELEKQIKFMEFRKLFRLNTSDVIIEEELGIHIYDKVKNSFISGIVYFSRHSIHFASTQSPNTAPSVSKLASVITPIPSSLFEATSDCMYQLSIPPDNVVSVKKSSTPPAGIKGVASAFLFSGFSIIQTRSKTDIWFAFQSTKTRDKIHDMILSRTKTASQENDFEIGGRNGFVSPTIDRFSVYQPPHKESSLTLDNLQLRENAGLEHVMQSIGGTNNGDIAIFTTPLKHVFKSFYTPEQSLNDPSLPLWFDYFNGYGKDACMTKNLRMMRDLLVKTCGVPTALRGDFWLLVSGAWNCSLEKDTYVNLLIDNAGRSNASTDEIEKDVRRSLPEHTAYQSKAGIGALRRVLVAYSFRNPSIGYAQALNIISAILLLHLKEKDAFQMLSTLVEKIVPDHYSRTLVGSVVDQQVFTHLVKHFMPALTTHMEAKYMELSTFTVPWFVCLFLNTISLKMNAVILDSFFLDGPKFLLWFGLAIIKLNEKVLLTKRDDEVFMNVFKSFFERLAAPSDDTATEVQYAETLTLSDEILKKMTGKPLMQYTLWISYSQFSQHVTNEIVESLRVKFMLISVHQMEESYQKSQIRNICEIVKMTYLEVLIVYQEVRLLEFLRDASDDSVAKDAECAASLVDLIVRNGGWGHARNKARLKPTAQSSLSSTKKSIPLSEFKRVFSKLSPWRSEAEKPRARQAPISGQKYRRQSLAPIITKLQLPDDHQISIVDRLYFYTAFNQSAASTSDQDGYTIDLGDMLQLLESVTKQPLQQKFRFLFDIHDLDGDGFLNKNELKATMDSLLEMFEGAQTKFGDVCQPDEIYLRAVSTFLCIALKSSKDKSADKDDRDMSKSRSFSTGGARVGEDGYKLGFHEFLLSVMSQSVFVSFFERVWEVTCVDAVACLTLAV